MSDELDRALADLPGFNYPSGIKPRRTTAATKARIDPMADDWDAHPTIKKLKGVDTEFFTIGNLAAALGNKPVTVRSWERKGWLPLSRFRTPAPSTHPIEGKKPMGKRLYTRAQIEAVVKAARDAGVLDPSVPRPNWPKFTKQVVDAWKSNT